MTTFKVTGMTCANCVRHVTEAVQTVQGVHEVRVDLDAATAEVAGDINADAVIAAIANAGYEASL